MIGKKRGFVFEPFRKSMNEGLKRKPEEGFSSKIKIP